MYIHSPIQLHVCLLPSIEPTYQSMYPFYLLPIIILFTEEQLKIVFEKAIVAIKSNEDAHKFVASATHIADRVEDLVIAEIKTSDDPQLKRNLTIAKDTLHKRKTILDFEIKSSCKLHMYTLYYPL